MESKLIYIALTLFAGMIVTFQGPINGALGKVLKPELATFWSFLSGTIIIAIYLVVKKETIPTIEEILKIPRLYLIGGVIGVLYVFLITLLIPKLGSANTIFLIILSQMLTALIIDHFGLIGVEVKSINIYKIIGFLFMFLGVFLINKK